ncbi:MAG: hypothetical protein Ct9H90mP25_3830 [Gammaproteobacteria bacterium]|nr:MAG: hypothetical protein Ct9H90mP25_3830 [Gammaproteobacteria bacterium]
MTEYKKVTTKKKHFSDLSVCEYSFCVQKFLFPPKKLLCVFNQSDDVTLSRTGATSGAAQSGQPIHGRLAEDLEPAFDPPFPQKNCSSFIFTRMPKSINILFPARVFPGALPFSLDQGR